MIGTLIVSWMLVLGKWTEVKPLQIKSTCIILVFDIKNGDCFEQMLPQFFVIYNGKCLTNMWVHEHVKVSFEMSVFVHKS